MKLEDASVEQLVKQLRKKGVNVAKIEEVQVTSNDPTHNIYLAGTIIKIARSWLITPFDKKILKQTGGPMVCTWLKTSDIEPGTEIKRLSDVGKD